MCKIIGCEVTPSYNTECETKPLYCAAHRLEGMINVKQQKCVYPGCKVLSSYNNEGEAKPLYCVAHKSEEMINVKRRNCAHLGCNVTPLYNNEGEIKALYCAKHKSEKMINVRTKPCIYPGCKVTPTYNNEGETKALYCVAHKLKGMINVRDKPCIHPGCKKQHNYNFAGQTKALYCATHRLEGMVNIKFKSCKNEWCLSLIRSEKYSGFCLFCYINMFPDKPVTRNYKTKEYAVVEFIKNIFSEFSWASDKIISDGCSKKRPDLLLDLGYQVIIIEIDENQHINYDCSCENKRIMELSQDLGHRPIVLIRFNPDNYYEKNGANITSCWSLNKNGICVVKQSKKEEWNERLNTLKEHVAYWINTNNKTNKTIEIIQLFYDLNNN